jgi:hypothetical protein
VDESGFDPPEAPAKEEPVTWGQRALVAFVGIFCLSIAAWCFHGGNWGRGLFWSVFTVAALWAAFSR